MQLETPFEVFNDGIVTPNDAFFVRYHNAGIPTSIDADKHVLLEGHCDWRGTAEYNLGLGDRRSNAVKEYLQKLGVDVARLEIVSKGDLDAKEHATGEEMAKDRRVELAVMKQ